jgi:hypothetical protein
MLGGGNDSREQEYWIVTALLLLPTGEEDGQFRRVGQFETGNNFSDARWEEFTNKTNILDQRYFTSKSDNGEYTISII